MNPGAPQAALVALHRLTGEVLWKSAGAPAAYAAFISGQFGGRSQIVGHDALSLGGWDPQTARQPWSPVPHQTGDFNGPTLLDLNGRLLVTTENNGTRLYGFGADGRILKVPLAHNDAFSADASTPVVVGVRWSGALPDCMA